jgi:transcriptional regulator with XRE-family HTH domain
MEMSFGARLRQQRERQSVALATIATETKIKISLLEGLERDDVSHWPGGIFRRSYLRAYAERIGLDPDGVVREFLTLYPDSTDEVSPVEVLAQAEQRRRPPTRLTYLISSAISALPSLRSQFSTRVTAASDEPLALEDFPGTASSATPDLESPPPMMLEELEPARGFEERGDQPLLDLGGEEPPFAPRREAMLLRHDMHMAHDADPMLAEAALSPEYFADVSLEPPRQSEEIVSVAQAPVQPTRQDVFGGIAELCTRLGRVCDARDVLPVLEDATTLLNAIGLILWTWDPRAHELRPTLSHGYSAELLSHVPAVGPDSDNAIGSAFRSAETRIVNGDDRATGALAVPLITPSGCTGVLAAEFRDSIEQLAWVRAVVTILAAQLSMLVGSPAALRAATA